MVREQIKSIVGHPAYVVIALIVPMITAIVVAYIQFYVPAKVEAGISQLSIQERVRERIVNSEFKIAEVQAQLQVTLNRERGSDQELLQQLVNTYEHEAWVKYFDFQDQTFRFMVINKQYSKKYGIIEDPYGKTDAEMYAERDLTEAERLQLLEYALNDRKAVIAGVGHCVVFEEWASPVKSPHGFVDTFKKCMLTSGSQTYVFGRLER